MKQKPQTNFSIFISKIVILFTDLLMVGLGFGYLAYALLGILSKKYMSVQEQNDVLFIGVLFVVGMVGHQAVVSNWNMFLQRKSFQQRVRIQDYSHDLNSTLEVLSEALEQTGTVIHKLEGDIHNKQTLVQQLESQRKIAQQAIRLSREQVNAVTALFLEEITKQSRVDFRREILKDILIFVLGVIVTIALKWFGLPI